MTNTELQQAIENARSLYVKELIKVATSGYSSASQQVQASRALEAIYRELKSEEGDNPFLDFEENECVRVINIGGV